MKEAAWCSPGGGGSSRLPSIGECTIWVCTKEGGEGQKKGASRGGISGFALALLCSQVGCYYYYMGGQVGKETKGIGEIWCFLLFFGRFEGGLFSSCDVGWGGGGINLGYGTGLLWYAMHIIVPRRGNGDMGISFFIIAGPEGPSWPLPYGVQHGSLSILH